MVDEQEESRIGQLWQILVGAGLTFVGRGFDRVTVFAFNALLANLLTTAAYGVYAYAATITMILTVFTSHGAGKSLIRHIPANDDNPFRQNAYFGTATISIVLFGLIGSIGLFVAAPIISAATINVPILTTVLRVFSVLVLLKSLLGLLNEAFVSVGDMKYRTLTNDIFEPALRLVCVIGVLFAGYWLFEAALATVFALAVTVAVAGVLLTVQTPLSIRTPIEMETVRSYYRTALPVAASDVATLLYDRADLLIVGFFLTGELVGIYNAAVVLATILLLPNTAFSSLFRPIASQLHATGNLERLNDLYGVVTRWSLTFGLAAGSFLVVYRTELLAVFGETFTAGAAVLIWLAVGQLARTATGPSSSLLYLTGNQRILMGIEWTFGIFNVIASILLIQSIGLIGPALSGAVATGAAGISTVIALKRVEGLFPYSWTSIKPIVATVPTILVLLLMQNVLGVGFLLAGPLAVLTMGGALWGMGIEEDDRQLFGTLSERFSR